MVLALLITLPIGEMHRFFAPTLKQWYLFSKTVNSIQWYAKDSEEAIAWIIFLSVWYIREKDRNKLFSSIIFAFVVYRSLDFVAYWVNARYGGLAYSMLVYGTSLLAGLVKYKQWKSR